MNFFKWILNLFKRKPKEQKVEYVYTPSLPFIEPVKKEKRTKAQIMKRKLRNWQNKPYKGKAHRMPLAKFMNPEKYL